MKLMIEKKITLNFPPQFNLVCLSIYTKPKKLFYCYNHMYYFKFSANNFILDLELNSILIILKNNDNKNYYYRNFFKKYLKSLDCYFFLKIKFKGKGYKILFIQKKKIMHFFFGRSHYTMIRYKKIILKKYLKYKFVLKSNNLESLNKIAKLTANVKPLNIFTLRGLRVSRSIIYKRKGKKGSYI